MKSFFLLTLIICCSAFWLNASYVDHRGHNVDSLERVVARWTPETIDRASFDELMSLSIDWRALMSGYEKINGVKCEYYARKALALGRRMDWKLTVYDSAKMLGQIFWAGEKYDSAAFYYNVAMVAIEQMQVVPSTESAPGLYSQEEKDNALSSMYGTLGNLYSMMDSVGLAMNYYARALDIFKAHDWNNSCAVCYYNMAETQLGVGCLKDAEEFYGLSLQFAKAANDSLWIASALKGYGNLYLALGKTRKAIRCLDEADRYFSLHEDEELLFRMETLDFTSQVLKMQKRSLVWWLVLALALFVLLMTLAGVYYLLERSRREQKETAEVLGETIAEIGAAPKNSADEIKLNDREVIILQLLSQGLTTPQIADKICLSPETVKWYRKKLLAKFDATSSAELTRKALSLRII